MAKNRSMAAKRITGPTANSIMLTNMKTAHCKYCDAMPDVTLNLEGGKTKKVCMEHLTVTNESTTIKEHVVDTFNAQNFLRSLGWR
jgi:hypothetical protein